MEGMLAYARLEGKLWPRRLLLRMRYVTEYQMGVVAMDLTGFAGQSSVRFVLVCLIYGCV